MSNRLQSKVAAITGASQGIGLAIAQRFAAEGADISFCYRSNRAGADEVVASIQKLGRKCSAFQYDVGDVPQGQKFIADTIAQFGKIDVLVNNAGLERRADFWDATEADYDAVLNVNLKGVFFITQAFVRHLMASASGANSRPGGKIINISSVHEELPFPHFTSYCASKGGVKMFTRNLSIELAPLGITINSIAPAPSKLPSTKISSTTRQAQLPARKYPSQAARHTRRRSQHGCVPRLLRLRLRHRYHLLPGWRPNLELSGTMICPASYITSPHLYRSSRRPSSFLHHRDSVYFD
jgi:glucose 1-dehydrogenase